VAMTTDLDPEVIPSTNPRTIHGLLASVVPQNDPAKQGGPLTRMRFLPVGLAGFEPATS
jgi:hypothetical protein